MSSNYPPFPDIHHPSGHVPELLRGSAAGQREGEVELPGGGLAAADLPAAAGGGAAARPPAGPRQAPPRPLPLARAPGPLRVLPLRPRR